MVALLYVAFCRLSAGQKRPRVTPPGSVPQPSVRPGDRLTRFRRRPMTLLRAVVWPQSWEGDVLVSRVGDSGLRW